MGPLPEARTLTAPPTPARQMPACCVDSNLLNQKQPSTALSGFHGCVGKPIVALCAWKVLVLAGVDPAETEGSGPACQGRGRNQDNTVSSRLFPAVAQNQRPLRTAWDNAKGGASEIRAPRRGILWQGDGNGGPSSWASPSSRDEGNQALFQGV